MLTAADALPPSLRARLYRLHGGTLILCGETDRGEERYREAIEIFRSLGDESNVVSLQARFVVHAGHRAEPDEVRRLIGEVRRSNAAVDHPAVEPLMLSTLARLAHREGDLEQALELFRQSVELTSAGNFTVWVLWTLVEELEVELELQRIAEAEQTGRRVLALASHVQDSQITSWALTSLALAALARNDVTRAGRLWGAVVEEERTNPGLGSDELVRLGAPFSERTDAVFRAAVEEGRALPLEEAVELALRDDQTLP